MEMLVLCENQHLVHLLSFIASQHLFSTAIYPHSVLGASILQPSSVSLMEPLKIIQTKLFKAEDSLYLLLEGLLAPSLLGDWRLEGQRAWLIHEVEFQSLD